MDSHGTGSRAWQPYSPPSPSDQHLSHRISNISDITDYDTYSSPAETYNPPLRGRESLVSLPSSHDLRGNTYAQQNVSRSSSNVSGWSLPFAGYGGGGGGAYQPVDGGGGSHSQPPRNFGRGYSLRRNHGTIVEEDDGPRESIDMATLLPAAAPMGTSDAYAPLAKDDQNGFDGMPYDVTGFVGPATSQDEEFLKRRQQQEASGHLTGGLGSGFPSSGAVIKESDLLATNNTVDRSLTRSFTKRRPVGRRATIKALAQDEANKRGEVVEVIMEESEPMPSDVDLSLMVGPNPDDAYPGMRRSTLPVKHQRTEVFFPKPDWKPFSMRWPYLLMLIILSILLGGTQEVVYQVSTRNPLLTFKSPNDINPFNYFAFKFAPTLLSVSYGVLWQITDFEVKRLEAFYQLSKEGGALAAESINVDYITHFSFLRPFRAIYCKHYAVAVSSIASILAISLVPTLSAASISLQPDRDERQLHPEAEKFITINAVWSRFLTVLLFIIAFLGCILFWQLQTRRSGLLADVKGIAGLASMAVSAHILMDFKDMDVATHQDIHHKLKNHRYILKNSTLAPDDENPVSSQEQERYKENHLSKNPHPLMLTIWGFGPFILGIILFAGLIPAFLFTPVNALTDKAPGVVTAIAVCIKICWGGLDTSVRMMEPYYILSKRHAPATTLSLDYTAMPFALVPVKALSNRHMLVFFVGFGTVMTELLTVLVTSLATVEGRAFTSLLGASGSQGHPGGGGGGGSDASDSIEAGQETEVSFWITFALASFILAYMAAVAAVVFARRRHPFLPRQPNTIASVLAFIHQSKMLYDFVGTAGVGGAEMVRRLERAAPRGKTYGLGWFEGRDGQPHCGVDQEELMSSYKVGYDYAKSNRPWVEQPSEWL
ncbi:uncharacterized protein E0L32_000027 [Thyridium curvatum]|uniref:Uncharacterized protein n=1 Tax=Thyridium curvatum TaxID=1093900 RepID=A0A507B7N0_9PEZI|nr:uncharacterized protein E0L32_000027 [Thyridium curvatum]TPX15693.1 hypothetical protein E0L32_000027 [Thyridium curvatum]